MADWLNSTFSGLDFGVASAFNSIQSEFLNVFCKSYSLLGDKGICFILISAILLLFSKTRKIGCCTLLAMGLGVLITNIALKETVARVRPYEYSQTLRGYWIQAGSNFEGDPSFPSGHTTGVTAFAVSFFLICNKKWSWAFLPVALLMGVCRLYLAVHFATDVIAGFLVGIVVSVISYYVTNLVFKAFENNYDKGFCRFVLRWNVKDLFVKNNKKQAKLKDKE